MGVEGGGGGGAGTSEELEHCKFCSQLPRGWLHDHVRGRNLSLVSGFLTEIPGWLDVGETCLDLPIPLWLLPSVCSVELFAMVDVTSGCSSPLLFFLHHYQTQHEDSNVFHTQF